MTNVKPSEGEILRALGAIDTLNVWMRNFSTLGGIDVTAPVTTDEYVSLASVFEFLGIKIDQIESFYKNGSLSFVNVEAWKKISMLLGKDIVLHHGHSSQDGVLYHDCAWYFKDGTMAAGTEPCINYPE